MLCLSLIILSHQTVAYGCAWCSRTLLLAISEQSSLIYTPSNTRLPTHAHSHTPHSMHTHTHTHHIQFTHTPPSSTTHKTHKSYPQLTHKYICTSAHPMAAHSQVLPRFSKMGTSLHCQPTACLNIHTF